MKRHTVLSALLATSLLASTWAFGQGDSRNPYEEQQRYDQRGRGENSGWRSDRYRRDGDRYNRYNRDHRGERGGGPEHSYYRGDRIPSYYHTRHYIVEDWRAHHLSPPPRGYHWVQAGGDYLLVAIATGVIVQMLLND